jgi:hypothetical protein
MNDCRFGLSTLSMVSNIVLLSSFRPLEKKPANNTELCMCCSCYPFEEDEEEMVQYVDELNCHPYLAPTPPNPVAQRSNLQWQDANETQNNV